MTTATAPPGRGIAVVRRPSRRVLAVGTLVGWVLLWALLRGQGTLYLAPSELTPLHRELNGLADAIGASRSTSALFTYGFDLVRAALDSMVGAVQGLIAQPSGGRPVPAIGWLGVVALAALLAGALGGLRVALLTVGGLLVLGLQGLWVESMDTLALTLSAVLLCLLIGIPLGVWAGCSERLHRALLPVLDVLQVLPTFVYLAPLTLFFLIGPAAATIATLLYALPPVIRLTAHGVRSVPASVVDASTSLGATRLQSVRTVLPLARRTIALGINQTMMAALSMATIAALIDAPGLGQTVVKALQTLDVGVAFNAGLAIVVLAVLLDRTTTAASGRADARRRRPTARERRLRGLLLAAGAAAALGAVALSRTYLWAATFPTSVALGARTVDIGIGTAIARGAEAMTGWTQDHLSGLTGALQDGITRFVLDPLEALLTDSPWQVVVVALVVLAWSAGGGAVATTTAVGLALLIGSGLWFDAMTTLASTVLATLAVLGLALAAGVWLGRGRRADALVRPLLDAGQTLPAFVYLVPCLALFGASRFTAIVAAVVYAAPVAIKIVADGVRGVPVATVEAAHALGATRWQTLVGVQLPMARRSLALAANQGVVHVLAMVVVGGLVGAGALGYDVVAGFSRSSLYGKGLVAGFAIVLLGVLLDRVTQAAARRTGVPRRAGSAPPSPVAVRSLSVRPL